MIIGAAASAVVLPVFPAVATAGRLDPIIEVVTLSICPSCYRESLYHGYFWAGEYADCVGQLDHRERHELLAALEAKRVIMPIGHCLCGHPGNEYTELTEMARIEGQGRISDELMFEIVDARIWAGLV